MVPMKTQTTRKNTDHADLTPEKSVDHSDLDANHVLVTKLVENIVSVQMANAKLLAKLAQLVDDDPDKILDKDDKPSEIIKALTEQTRRSGNADGLPVTAGHRTMSGAHHLSVTRYYTQRQNYRRAWE